MRGAVGRADLALGARVTSGSQGRGTSATPPPPTLRHAPLPPGILEFSSGLATETATLGGTCPARAPPRGPCGDPWAEITSFWPGLLARVTPPAAGRSRLP